MLHLTVEREEKYEMYSNEILNIQKLFWSFLYLKNLNIQRRIAYEGQINHEWISDQWAKYEFYPAFPRQIYNSRKEKWIKLQSWTVSKKG